MQKGAEAGRSWSDIRGELTVYLLVAITIGMGLLWWEDIQLRRQQIETTEKFHRVLEMHTDTIQKALEAHRSGSSAQE